MMAEAEAALDEAKRKRTAKAALTRRGNTLRKKLKESRPRDEIMEAFHGMKTAFENLVVKHEEYTQLIQDDEAFEAEEKWLEECEDFYLQMEIGAKDYSKAKSVSKGEKVWIGQRKVGIGQRNTRRGKWKIRIGERNFGAGKRSEGLRERN